MLKIANNTSRTGIREPRSASMGQLKARKDLPHLGLQVEEADVIALFNALIKHYQHEGTDLNRRLDEANAENKRLEHGFSKLYKLLAFHASEAPSESALVKAAQNVADHYRWSWNKGNPKIDWIKWKSI
jgi:hypothetical protein